MKPLRIYIAGPYTKGDVAINVRLAIDEWNALADLGFIPYCPHLTHFVHMIHPRPYEDWMTHAMAWLRACDALIRLPGHSKGAKREEKLAWSLDIPLFYNRKELLTWAATQ